MKQKKSVVKDNGGEKLLLLRARSTLRQYVHCRALVLWDPVPTSLTPLSLCSYLDCQKDQTQWFGIPQRWQLSWANDTLKRGSQTWLNLGMACGVWKITDTWFPLLRDSDKNWLAPWRVQKIPPGDAYITSFYQNAEAVLLECSHSSKSPGWLIKAQISGSLHCSPYPHHPPPSPRVSVPICLEVGPENLPF